MYPVYVLPMSPAVHLLAPQFGLIKSNDAHTPRQALSCSS